VEKGGETLKTIGSTRRICEQKTKKERTLARGKRGKVTRLRDGGDRKGRKNVMRRRRCVPERYNKKENSNKLI